MYRTRTAWWQLSSWCRPQCQQPSANSVNDDDAYHRADHRRFIRKHSRPRWDRPVPLKLGTLTTVEKCSQHCWHAAQRVSNRPTALTRWRRECKKREECIRMKRHSVRKGIGNILDFESPPEHASSFIARKALRWIRILLWLDQRSKTTSHWRYSDTKQHGELRSDRGSTLVNEFFLQFSSFNLNDTFKAGNWSFHVFRKLVFFTKYDSIKRQGDSRKRGSKWNWFPSSACVRCWRWQNGETRCLLPNLACAPKPTKI